jgi:hypothetical protein
MMNCKAVALWLYNADRLADPPVEVSAHLRECSRCRRRRGRLRRLHRAVRRLPPPADNPAARDRILMLIAARQPAVQVVSVMKPRRRWPGLLARAAAVLLLVGGLGWLLTRHLGDPEPVGPPAVGEDEVMAKLVHRHVQLAEGLPPEQRFQVLAAMAADLGGEALRLAHEPSGDLAAVVRLYERLLREGVVDRARKLPAGQQPRLLAPVLAELRKAHAEAEAALRTAGPTAAASLRSMAAAARDAHNELGPLVGEKLL